MENLQERITKKQQQIEKLTAKFNKYAELVSNEFLAIINQYVEDGDFAPVKEYRIRTYPNNYFLQGSDYDLYSTANDLYTARQTLTKYQKQLEVEIAKNATLNELPQVLVEFKNYCIEKWDKYDEWKKNAIREDMKKEREMEYKDYRTMMWEKWGRNYRDAAYISSEDIHKSNVKDAENLILNLIDRVTERVGQITDCGYLYLDNDNNGYTIINGRIIGTKGECRVESIGAGGYNIQRYHIRVLVH